MESSWVYPDVPRTGPFAGADLRLPKDDLVMLSALTRLRDPEQPPPRSATSSSSSPSSSSAQKQDEIPVFVVELNPACTLFLIDAYGWHSPMNYLECSRQIVYAAHLLVTRNNAGGRGAMSAFKFEKDVPRAAKGNLKPVVRYRVLREKPQAASMQLSRPSVEHGGQRRAGGVRPKYVDELGQEFRYQHLFEFIHVDPSEARDLPYHVDMHDNRSVVMTASCYWLPTDNYEHFRTRARHANITNVRPDVVMPPFRTVHPLFSHPAPLSMSNQVYTFLNSQLLQTTSQQTSNSMPLPTIDIPTPTLHNPYPAASKPPFDKKANLHLVTPRIDSLVDVFMQTTVDLTRTKLVYSEHTAGPMAWALIEAALSEALQQAGLSGSSFSEGLSPSWFFEEFHMSLGQHAELDIPWTHRITLYDGDSLPPANSNSRAPLQPKKQPVSAGNVRRLTGTWDCSHPGTAPAIRGQFRLRRSDEDVGGTTSKL